MTTTNILPNGSTATVGTPTIGGGAGSYHAALNDSSNSTYLQATSSQWAVVLDFGTFTLPAGAVITAVVNKFRAALLANSAVIDVQRSGSYYGGTSFSPAGSPTDYTNTNVANLLPFPSSQADIDGYQVVVSNAIGFPGTPDLRLYEVSVDVTYVPPPTATATAPTGVVTSTLSPTATWSHTPGSDAPGGQAKYQVRVFTAAQYGAGGFDPSTSTAAYDSGVVASALPSATVGPLANSTTYRAYVRTAQTTLGIDQWSAWSYSGFATSVTTSDITSVAATADNTNARVGVVVTRTATTPCWTSLEVQASYDAGATWNYVRGYSAYPIPSQAVTATASTDLVNLTSHNLSAGNTVVFSGLTGGAGLTAGTTYFVIASGLTANAFKVSTTSGGSAVDITTDMTAGTMQSALTASLNDYEAPNGTAAIYRARATYLLSGLPVTGAWVSSSAATWSSATAVWMKDVNSPTLNTTINVIAAPDPTYDRTLGTFRPLGSTFPIVVADVRQAGASSIMLRTSTAAAETTLRALLAGGGPLLLQFPPTTGWGWGSRYVVAGALREARFGQPLVSDYRRWEVDLTEVARPAVT